MKEYLTNEFPDLQLLFQKESLREDEIKDNNIQLFLKAMVFSDTELLKWDAAEGGRDKYIAINKKELYRQLLIDISNTLWMGVKGEIELSGMPPNNTAKTMHGINSIMEEKGSLTMICNERSIFNAMFEAQKTEGIADDCVIFCAPHYAKILKDSMPMKRFLDSSSFPEKWKDVLMCIDMDALSYFLEHKVVVENKTTFTVQVKFSIQFNPLSSYKIQLQ